MRKEEDGEGEEGNLWGEDNEWDVTKPIIEKVEEMRL